VARQEAREQGPGLLVYNNLSENYLEFFENIMGTFQGQHPQ
jgi:hypothetical protein